MFKDALKEAEVLDAEFARTNQLKGPLHGLPVSFKDQCTCEYQQTYHFFTHFPVEITGYDSTIGYTQWTNKLSTSDADVRTFQRLVSPPFYLFTTTHSS